MIIKKKGWDFFMPRKNLISSRNENLTMQEAFKKFTVIIYIFAKIILFHFIIKIAKIRRSYKIKKGFLAKHIIITISGKLNFYDEI